MDAYLAVIDWSDLTDGLQTAFESGVTSVLPVAGAIIAAFLIFRTVKRFLSS